MNLLGLIPGDTLQNSPGFILWTLPLQTKWQDFQRNEDIYLKAALNHTKLINGIIFPTTSTAYSPLLWKLQSKEISEKAANKCYSLYYLVLDVLLIVIIPTKCLTKPRLSVKACCNSLPNILRWYVPWFLTPVIPVDWPYFLCFTLLVRCATTKEGLTSHRKG